MMPSSTAHRQPSRSRSKRSKLLGLPNSKPRIGLAVDTSVARYGGRAPQEVYPYESKTKEMHFVSLNDIRALQQNNGVNDGFTQKLDSGAYVRPGPNRSVANNNIRQARHLRATGKEVHDAPPSYNDSIDAVVYPIEHTASEASNSMPLHKRTKGLRPAPLDLNTAISPSDRSIPIGIAVPSATMRHHTQSPESAASLSNSMSHRQTSLRYGQVATPTIVITPAKEDFESRFTTSPREMARSGSHRTSSLYSRYTNGLPQRDSPPPVPPMPRFATDEKSAFGTGTARASNTTTFEDRTSPMYSELSTAQYTPSELSYSKVDNKASSLSFSATSRRLRRQSSQSGLPTPRRSKGYWNILSPFSASIKHNGIFSRSPPVREGDEFEQRSIPTAASSMGMSDPRADYNFSNRPSGDDALRSAPPTNYSQRSFTSQLSSDSRIRTPPRSETAPGALDLGNADEVNIYRVPSQGAASDYYDSTRNFPSMCGSPEAIETRRSLDDWSPSQSVARTSVDDRARFGDVPLGGEAALYYDKNKNYSRLPPDEVTKGWRSSADTESRSVSQRSGFGGVSTEQYPASAKSYSSRDEYGGSPVYQNRFSSRGEILETSPYGVDSEGGYTEYGAANTPPRRNFVSSASDRGLDEGLPLQPFSTQCGIPREYDQQLSPRSDFSATPVVENAQTAQFIRPPSSDGDIREVDLSPVPPSTARGMGLEAATMASRDDRSEVSGYTGATGMNEKAALATPAAAYQTNHDSHDFASEDGDERALYPAGTLDPEKNSIDGTDDGEHKPPWYKRVYVALTGIGILLTILLVVLLPTFLLPKQHDNVPVEARWLNLTGFPPLPTGIATIIQPKTVNDVSGCVNTDAMWTCSVPANEDLNTPSSTQPNFRFLITFKNNTASNETALWPSSQQNISSGAHTAPLVRRSPWSDISGSASPPSPSLADQIFLGQTTDNISEPYNGEETPFYISLLDPEALQGAQSSKLKKRDGGFNYPYPSSSSSSSSSSRSHTSTNNPTSTVSAQSSAFAYPYPLPTTTESHVANPTGAPSTQTAGVPSPALGDNDEPACAELYPLAESQPLRLFNRGQADEHYGFYTYFDRSIYLSNVTVGSLGSNSTGVAGAASDVSLQSASAVCTWSQTRLHVQIWTRKGYVTSLNTTASTNTPTSDSTANDMTSPGSFPYVVSISLDRHGGDASTKGVYCYGVDGDHHVTKSVNTWVVENRAFQGALVNPATMPGANGTDLSKRDTTEGSGFDGGSGGCACQWQN